MHTTEIEPRRYKSFTPKMKRDFIEKIEGASDLELSRLYDEAKVDSSKGYVIRSLLMQREMRIRVEKKNAEAFEKGLQKLKGEKN